MAAESCLQRNFSWVSRFWQAYEGHCALNCVQAAAANKKDAALYSKMFKPTKESPVKQNENAAPPANGHAAAAAEEEPAPMETEGEAQKTAAAAEQPAAPAGTGGAEPISNAAISS